MSKFDLAAQTIAPIEGGYVDNPNDSGGETNHGVTARVARAHGYTKPMVEMTEGEARAIIKAGYWDVLQLDTIADISYPVAYELFDTSVNMGVDTAGRFLQRSLNVLNMRGSWYADIKVDGQIGAMTLAALRQYFARRGPQMGTVVLQRMLNSLQGARYVLIAEARDKDEEFVFGWFQHRVVI